jgi:hypothetical protein
MVVTSPQGAIRQAAPVVAAIAITVDGKTVFANTTDVAVGDLPRRNSPSHQSGPVPTGNNIETVIRASTATVATAPLPSVSVVIAPPPKISTSIISGAPALLSRSVPVPRPPPSSQAKFSVSPLPTTPTSSSVVAPPPPPTSKSTSSVVVVPTPPSSAAIPPSTVQIVSTTEISTTVKSSASDLSPTMTKTAPVAAEFTKARSAVLVFAKDSA